MITKRRATALSVASWCLSILALSFTIGTMRVYADSPSLISCAWEGQGPFDSVVAPPWANDSTVAVQIRRDSLGASLNGWPFFMTIAASQ